MKIKLAYGRDGLDICLPADRTTVIEPEFVPGLPDEAGALRTALRDPVGTRPLRHVVEPGQTVAISVCDITRPMPSATVLPAVLRELRHMPNDQVVILVATGTHRANTPEELAEMLGPDVVGAYHVVNHDAFDPHGLASQGETPEGLPIWLNRRWVEADIRITTGFVEPHFFAGFSGGPKMVAPGLAGFETTMRLHNADMIAHPRSTWGVTLGNPIHDAVRQIARQTRVDFSVDVTINRDGRITSVYAGDLETVHRAASRFARSTAMQQVDSPFDVAVTTNSGYPLDMNLYPGRQGDVGGGSGGEARRDDHMRRRMLGGHPEPWGVQRYTLIGGGPGRAATKDSRAGPRPPRPVASTDTGADTAKGGGPAQVGPPDRCPGPSRPPDAGPGRRGRGGRGAETARAGQPRLRAAARASDHSVSARRRAGPTPHVMKSSQTLRLSCPRPTLIGLDIGGTSPRPLARVGCRPSGLPEIGFDNRVREPKCIRPQRRPAALSAAGLGGPII